MAVMMNNTCLADSFAIFLFCCPIYCEQTIAPPAASAENACITRILIESTSDTAEIAADPILLTIIVSAVPIIEFNNCSRTTGIRIPAIILFENICCCFTFSVITFSAP